MADSLGNLGQLPPEIREIIFVMVLPQNFRQVFNFDCDTGAISRPPGGCLPALAWCSRKIRDELFHILMRRRGATITVTKEGMFTNFPTEDLLDVGENLVKQHHNTESNIRIPMCSTLLFSIQIAYPRDAEAMLLTRRNLKIAVNIINQQDFTKFPKIRVQVDADDCIAPCYCGYNDFALLAAPFLDLQSRCADFSIHHPPRYEPCNWKVAMQCDAIEDAVCRDEVTNYTLLYQQLILDLKLPLVAYEGIFRERSTDPKVRQRAISSGKDMLTAIRRLRDLLRAMRGVKEPAWVKNLLEVLDHTTDSPIITSKLETKICGEDWNGLCKWAAGLITSINPFLA
jgi:hypothetical protein